MKIRSLLSFQQAERPLELNLTPLIDVVFILLIFFMVSSSFVNNSQIPIERPDAESSINANNATTLIVTISRDGQLYLQDRPIMLSHIKSEAQSYLAQNSRTSALIHIDKQVSSGLLIQVTDQLRLAKVQNVAVATIEK